MWFFIGFFDALKLFFYSFYDRFFLRCYFSLYFSMIFIIRIFNVIVVGHIDNKSCFFHRNIFITNRTACNKEKPYDSRPIVWFTTAMIGWFWKSHAISNQTALQIAPCGCNLVKFISLNLKLVGSGL